MKERLSKKLALSLPYTREELEWLLAHIGDPNPEIRDELVYASFGHALMDHQLSITDFQWLATTALNTGLIASSAPTLTRSFTSLLFSLVLLVDNQENSPYYQQLSPTDRQKLFDEALLFLERETDSRGWEESIGWIHAIAHGAEFLLAASLHQDFPSSKIKTVWQTTILLLKRQATIFSAGEERRLALLISQLILQQKLSQTDLASWIEQTTFRDQTATDYFEQGNFENFLLAISTYLEKEEALTPLLKHTILEKWNGY